MRKVLAVLAVVALAALVVVALPGCGALTDRENAAAARLEAEAELERARASAERALTDAMAERSAVRRSEADAALTRWLTLLPVLALAFGVVLAGVVAVVALTRRSSMHVDPVVVALLERQDRRLNELERAQWHRIAQSQRGRLPGGDADKVIVLDLEDGGAVW